MSDRAEAIPILRQMRALIERGWTRHQYARNLTGNAVSPQSENAVRWCLIGAETRALCGSTASAVAMDRVERALGVSIGGAAWHHWNDAQLSKRPVLAAIDRAAALLESEAPNE